MENKTWCVVFENQQTGERTEREYPQIYQWETRKKLNTWLQNRTFELDKIIVDIQLLPLIKIKHETARLLGEIVYSKK